MSWVATHFIERISDTEQLNKKVKIIPLEVVLRNVTAGSFSKRFGVEEGLDSENSIVEFYYKNDDLDDPFINDEHVKFLILPMMSKLPISRKKRVVSMNC